MKTLGKCEFLRKQPVPKRIGIYFITSIIVVLTIILISLVIQFQNIKSSQQQIPNLFFKNYNEYSLEEIAYRAQNLILSIVDFRMGFFMTIRNTIINNLTQPYKNINTSLYYKKEPNSMDCMILASNSIFDCKMDLYTKFVIQSGWNYQTKRPVRRLNIFYQSLANQNDIMIKTISQNPDFTFNSNSINRLNFVFDNHNNSNILFITSFYQDVYGYTSQKLVSFSTQITLNDYRILIQFQTFGSFIKQTISRMTYSENANFVVLELNNTVEQKYSVVAFYQQPDPHINYTNLLDKGHFKNQLPNNQIIYSFSLPFSSGYNIGSLNFINQPLLNKNFILIIYSPRITKSMEDNTYNFISKLNITLVQVSVVLFSLIGIWMVVNVLLLAHRMSSKLNSIKNTITKYTKQPDRYNDIVYQLNNHNQTDYLVGYILKSIIGIIKMIEHNKQKLRKKSKKIQKDYYPLNMFHKQYMDKQCILDQQRFQKLKIKVSSISKKF